jgi:hypothetical protein
MPTHVNDIRELTTTTSGGLGFAHAKKVADQLEYSDDCRFAAHFALMGISSIWLADASLIKLANVAGKVLKVVRLIRTQEVARKVA